jgi:hypothetical protein
MTSSSHAVGSCTTAVLGAKESHMASANLRAMK